MRPGEPWGGRGGCPARTPPGPALRREGTPKRPRVPRENCRRFHAAGLCLTSQTHEAPCDPRRHFSAGKPVLRVPPHLPGRAACPGCWTTTATPTGDPQELGATVPPEAYQGGGGRGFPQACGVTRPGWLTLRFLSEISSSSESLTPQAVFMGRCGSGWARRRSPGLRGLTSGFGFHSVARGRVLKRSRSERHLSGWGTGPGSCRLPPFMGSRCVWERVYEL